MNRSIKDNLLIVLIFSIGLSAALYLHWPALTNYTTYKSDIRQCPNWAGYHQTSFQEDDLLVKYAQFNESPIQNLIYYIGTYLIDMVILTKLVAVIGYALSSLLFFLLGRRMFGTYGGIFTAIFFTFFPDQFDFFAGGFSKMWIIPLIFVNICILKIKNWKGLILLMPFSALAYPVTAVVIGLITFCYLILNIPDNKEESGRILRNLIIGSALAIIVLSIKYISPPAEIGGMTPGNILREMPEMYRGGLCRYLPTPELYKELLEFIYHPFIIYSSLIFLVFLGRRSIAWDKTWTALILAILIGYTLSDLFFMRLYIPNRYLRYSMAVLLIMWNAKNWELIFRKIPWKSVRVIGFVILVTVAGLLYKDVFKQGKDTFSRSRYAPINRFLRTLPEGILIAGHPFLMDDIPIQARRSVLCNYKLAHPWFLKYYNTIKERTLDTFDATFSYDLDNINKLYEKYGVTHFAIEKQYFNKARGNKDVYVEPYNDYIRALASSNSKFYLEEPPSESVLFENLKYVVIQLPIKAEGNDN